MRPLRRGLVLAGTLLVGATGLACSLFVSTTDYAGADDPARPGEGGATSGGDGAVATDGGTVTAEDAAPDARVGGRAFVAVGPHGVRVVSRDDGVTWSEVRDPGDAGLELASVVFGGARVVAGGVRFKSTLRLVASTDLVTWNDKVTPNADGVTALAFGAGSFLATRDDEIGHSFDGQSFEFTTVGFGASGIGFDGAKFVAVGSDATGAVSALSNDGISWKPAKVGGANLDAVVYGGGKWVAVGSGGRRGVSSDGVAWSFATPSNPALEYTGVAFGLGRFVTSAGSSSADGVTWTPDALDANGVAFGAGVFIAVDSDGQVYRSTTGLAWSDPVKVASGPLYAVAFGAW